MISIHKMEKKKKMDPKLTYIHLIHDFPFYLQEDHLWGSLLQLWLYKFLAESP